jgi:predicted nuclease of predicted toxin-antitoxin system
MKILLDENLPIKLKQEFSHDHQVNTVSEMNWQGKKNGELLGLLTLNSFDCLVTLDKNLYNQQNLKKFNVSVFILNARNNKIETLKPYIKKLLPLMDNFTGQRIVIVDV